MNPKTWAEPIGGPIFTRLGKIAARNDVWLIAGVAVSEANGFSQRRRGVRPER